MNLTTNYCRVVKLFSIILALNKYLYDDDVILIVIMLYYSNN